MDLLYYGVHNNDDIFFVISPKPMSFQKPFVLSPSKHEWLLWPPFDKLRVNGLSLS
jgi:hypothetical protein